MISRESILKGIDLTFESGLKIKHLTVSEVIDFGFILYYTFIKCFILKPQDLIVQLWGRGIYYENITHYQLFLMQIKDNEEYMASLFKLFTNCEKIWVETVDNDEILCYTVNGKGYYLEYSVFNIIYEYFKEVFMHKHSNKRYFAGEKTKKSILDEDYEEYVGEIKNPKHKSDTGFSDMISYISIKNKRDYEYVYSYPLARLYDEYIKTRREEEIYYLRVGISSGTYDGKKVSSDKLNWSKT